MFWWRRQDKTFLTVYCVMFSLTWFDDCSFSYFYTYFNNDSKTKLKPVQSPGWALVSSALPNLNMKHYKSVKLLSNFQNQVPLRKFKSLIQDFLATVLVFKPHIFSRDSLVAIDSYQSEKVRNTRIANLTIKTIKWVRLRDVFCSCYEIFTVLVSELQRGPHVVL